MMPLDLHYLIGPSEPFLQFDCLDYIMGETDGYQNF